MTQPTNDEIRRQLGPTGKERTRGVRPAMPMEEMKAHLVAVHMHQGASYNEAIDKVFGPGSFLRFWAQAVEWGAAQAEKDYGPNWRDMVPK